MPQEKRRYRTCRGVDLGQQQRIRIPGAAKIDPQKRFGQPWRYSSWELGPSWDPWRSHAESIGRPWRAPRTLGEAIYELENPIQPAPTPRGSRTAEDIQRYLAATLIVELYEVLVLLMWPDWEFDREAHFQPEDARQAMYDLLAAWAMYGAPEYPSIRAGGVPPWLCHPATLPREREALAGQFIQRLQEDLTDNESVAAGPLRTLSVWFGEELGYHADPLDGLRDLNRDIPWQLEEAIAPVLYRWWAEIALPLLMELARKPDYAYLSIPKPDDAQSPFYMGQPWWLVVRDETLTFKSSGSDEDQALLAASGGAIYSVWLWNPLDIQHYASLYSPITDLYALDLIPKQSPDEEEAREELYDQLQEELSQHLTVPGQFWADFSYDQIERFPHLTGTNLPDQEADPEKRVGAIYNDYFDVTENIDDAMESYHQNPKF